MSDSIIADSWLNESGIPGLFRERARELEERPFVFTSAAVGAWRGWSWAWMQGEADRVAGGLRALGVRRGDRVVVAAETRPEWYAADLAIMSLGAISVPLGLLSSRQEWAHILADSEPAAAVVSALAAEKFCAARGEQATAGRLSDEVIVALDEGVSPSATANSSAWRRWISLGTAAAGDLPGAGAAEAADDARLDDVCRLVYTSGTGGRAKGVMLTHRNQLANARGAAEVLADYGLEGHRFLSFLPLSHAYEHTASFVVPICLGAQVYLSRGPEHIAAELLTARPTMLTVVPRFLEVMEQRIRAQVERAPVWRRRLFATAHAAGARTFRREAGVADRLRHATAGALVRRQLRRRFGGALRCMLCAGAPLPRETGEFFNALGLPVHQGYGQTETAPGVTINRRARNRADRVGEPLRGVELRIAEDGEILVRGPNVMAGYWRDPEATAAALRDGWLHTGDIGWIDADGSLAITDRKKDFIKTAAGEMVAPQLVELALQQEPEIAQAAVYGDGESHLVALIWPAETAGARDAQMGASAGADAAHAAARRAVERANSRLARAQRVRRFALLPEACTVENGLLTATLKLRRRELRARHEACVRALFAE